MEAFKPFSVFYDFPNTHSKNLLACLSVLDHKTIFVDSPKWVISMSSSSTGTPKRP